MIIIIINYCKIKSKKIVKDILKNILVKIRIKNRFKNGFFYRGF